MTRVALSLRSEARGALTVYRLRATKQPPQPMTMETQGVRFDVPRSARNVHSWNSSKSLSTTGAP